MKFKMDLDKGDWKELHCGISVKLRPYPISLLTEDTDPRIAFDMYLYCLMDWKDVKDEDDKDIPYNDKNKRYLYNHYLAFAKEVNDVIGEDLSASVEGRESKN